MSTTQEKELNISCIDREDHILKWLLLWKSHFSISPKEQELLALIISRYLYLTDINIPDLEKKEMLLNTSFRKDICSKMGIPSSQLNFYINALKTKKLLVNNNIPEVLVPKSKLKFNFKYGLEKNS